MFDFVIKIKKNVLYNFIEMSSIEGNVGVLYLNPFDNKTVPLNINDNDNDNSVLIYINDIQVPFIINKCYLVNLTYDDVDYECNESITNINVQEEYYNLYKLFLNYPEYRNIIISKSELDSIINNASIKKIHLFSKEEKKMTYSKIKHKLSEINIEDETIKNDITDSLFYYVDNGYAAINGYLIRLNNKYREKSKIPLDAKTITDLVNHHSMNFFCCCCYKKECSNSKQFIPIEVMEYLVENIDLAFYKIAPRTTRDNQLSVIRGVATFYPYLKNVGDKIIIENYISSTTLSEIQYGCKIYNIILSEGIPYIDVKDMDRYGDIDLYSREKEILLPRNLLAELISINNADDEHTIRLSLIHPDQFNLDKTKCNESNLYSVKPFVTMGGKKTRKQNKVKTRKQNKTRKQKNKKIKKKK
jgi:hypothetical protein